MPYIETKTSVKITPEKEVLLKEKLGKAIECIPGKNESWLMLSFEDGVRMWFRGDNSAPSAMVEVKILGEADPKYYGKMTAVICDILSSELGIPSDRIYVKYEEIENWGWNGSNF